MFCKIVPKNDRLDVGAADRFAWYKGEGRGETQEAVRVAPEGETSAAGHIRGSKSP